MKKKKRTRWTQKERESFIKWHEKRLEELQYPPELCKELRRARSKFLSSC